jgi:hypothetical protein
MRKEYELEMQSATLRRLLDEYINSYAVISNMGNDEAIKYLQDINMENGICKFVFHKYNVLDIKEYLPEDFDEYSYYWNTPLQYYQEGKHPKLGLVSRISHIEKEIRINLPY